MFEIILNPTVILLMLGFAILGGLIGMLTNKKRKYDFKLKFESVNVAYWVQRKGGK